MNRVALAAACTLLAGCAEVVRVRASGPAAGPGAPGATRYQVDRLTFELPSAWAPRGDPLRLAAEHPQGMGRVGVQRADRAFPGEAQCLADAEAVLEKGAAQAANVRRHPTTFAGRKGVALEGDQGPWHGWAWGLCDGPVQYRISFWGAAPLREDVMAAWTTLTGSARFEP
jgi:hypothetical protein